MASAAEYAALSDAELRARAVAVAAMPHTPATSAELALIQAEAQRRGMSSSSGGSLLDQVTDSVRGIAGSATAPLHEVSNTAMWTAIGIAAAVVGVLAVVFAVVHFTNRI